MKIAILGKGGSGKSSMSWLIANFLSQDMNKQTLAIDGDHNMDLTTNLGVDDSNINYFKDFNTQFRQLSRMPQKGMWREYFNSSVIHFRYPQDSKLKEYIYNIKPNLDLIVVGLGDDDLMHYNVCSHGVSAPIKYMLPTLKLNPDTYVVYDSVAGVDMLNYGLYFGFDTLIVVVEGNKNSIKVAKQIQNLAKLQNIEISFILNKYDTNNIHFNTFERENAAFILGKINPDFGILNYDYSKIGNQNKTNLNNIFTRIESNNTFNQFEALKNFELNKK